MSIVSLSNNLGQRAEQFNNYFSTPIHLKPDSELCLLGWSGTLIGQRNLPDWGTTTVLDIVAINSSNDSLCIQIIKETTIEPILPPFSVQLRHGNYSQVQLAAELERTLNAYSIQNPTGAGICGLRFSCTRSTGPPPALVSGFSITTGLYTMRLEGPDRASLLTTTDGAWTAWGVNKEGVIQASPAATLSNPAVGTGLYAIDMKPMWNTATGQLVGSPGLGAVGYRFILNVGATTTAKQMECSVGVVTNSYVNYAKNNPAWHGDGKFDWANGNDSNRGQVQGTSVPYYAIGVSVEEVIGPAPPAVVAQLFITTANMQFPKEPVRKTAVPVSAASTVALGGVSTYTILLCPRHTAAGDYAIEIMGNNGVAALLSLGFITFTGEGTDAGIAFDYPLYAACHIPPAHLPADTILAQGQHATDSVIGTYDAANYPNGYFIGGGRVPNQDIEDTLITAKTAQFFQKNAKKDLWAGLFLFSTIDGWVRVAQGDTYTNALISVEASGRFARMDAAPPAPNFYICFDNLPIDGLLGGSAGGQPHKIVGVGSTIVIGGSTEKVIWHEVSNLNWIKLKNKTNESRSQISVKLVDDEGRLLKAFEKFNCWFSFRNKRDGTIRLSNYNYSNDSQENLNNKIY